MAIILPVLLLLIFGIIEVSGAWRTFQVVANVSREGARVGATPAATEDSVTIRMENALNANGLADSLATFDIGCDGSAGMCTTSGQETSIQVTYPYSFRLLGPIVTWICGGSCSTSFGTIAITSTTTMRKE
jgi:Flp pilus assembly protein TadG